MLDEAPDSIEYLSDYCKSIVDDRQKFKLMQEESRLFGEFMKGLKLYEISKDPEYVPNDENRIPAKLWELRQDIYGKNDYFLCSKPNVTADEYLNCLSERRQKMIDAIPATE